ncbi:MULTISPECIES: hypothetical protein [unclassified Brevundimonas]|uniref:hypothetical protein n=1 Tax=unclassified Brevundimonas TaxID=2622653 RepID=UPI001E49F57E|nr:MULTISPECIES: hypothetical protein [unclassified Brevundimonas]
MHKTIPQETLPLWSWEDLHFLLEEACERAPHQAAVMHMAHATRTTAQKLPPLELLREILALGALAHSRVSSQSLSSHPAASRFGSV